MRPDEQAVGFVLQQISNVSNKYLTKIYQMCYNKNRKDVKQILDKNISDVL